MLSSDRLIELIDARNNPTYPLGPSVIRFDDVVTDSTNLHNTRVTMSARGGGLYNGQVDLFYTRANLTALGDLEFIQEPAFTYESVLGMIAQLRNAPLGPDDFTNIDLPANMESGIVYNITLSARVDSLGWLGNTQVSLAFGIPNEAAGLSQFLLNTAPALFA